MRRIWLTVAAVAFAVSAKAEVKTWQLPKEVVANDFCRVTVEGKAVDVFALPKPEHPWNGGNHSEPYYAAFFDADGEVEVRVEFLGEVDVNTVEVLPRSAGAKVEVTGSKMVAFRATPPFNVAVEHGNSQNRALVIAANQPEMNVPDRNNPKVKWIEPGLHRENLRLKTGETLYLAPGAVVEGALQAEGGNITVCGRGIFSGIPWHWTKGPAPHCWLFKGHHLRIRDVAFAGAWNWAVVVDFASDVKIENIKVLGGKVLNDDGIDVCHATDVTIRDSFIRSQDDCIAPKWWCRNLLVENCVLWTDRANAVRLGWECDRTGGNFENLVFRDLDILRLSVEKREASNLWPNCAFQVQASAGAEIKGVIFDTVRFSQAEMGDVMLVAMTGDCGPYKGGGTIDGLRLQRISAERNEELGMTVRLAAIDRDHPVKNVNFTEVRSVGKREFVNADAPKICGGRELFNGRDLSGWYTWLKDRGRNSDPKKVFSVVDGAIRITGEEFGGLVSESEFSDYRLVLEYRWLDTPHYGWKANSASDSGLLFHSFGDDGAFAGMWQYSHEYNLIKGAAGDVWTVGPAKAISGVDYFVKGEVGKRRLPGYKPGQTFPTYRLGGDEVTIRGNDRLCRFDIAPDWKDVPSVKEACNERQTGEWNSAELVCDGDAAAMFFNSKLVNRLTKVSPCKGRLQLQSEGCGVEFRRISIYPIK